MQMVELWHLCCRDWHSSTSGETVMRTSQVIPDQTSSLSWPDPSPPAFLSLSPSHSYPRLVAMTTKETFTFEFFSQSCEAFSCSVLCPIHLPLSSIPGFKLHPFRPLSQLPVACLFHVFLVSRPHPFLSLPHTIFILRSSFSPFGVLSSHCDTY